MSENNETPDLSSSTSEDKNEVKGPSVKIQPMDGILKNIIEQMQKKNVSEEQDEDKDYEKLVDQIDNELSDDDEESEDDDEEEMEEDVRWTSLQKLLESHHLLCESFSKLLHEEEDEE